MDETLIIRELANGQWFFLNLSLACVFGLVVITAWREEPNWRKRPFVLLAIGLTTYFVGSLIMRLWVWTLNTPL
jgi:hypothetical protein